MDITSTTLSMNGNLLPAPPPGGKVQVNVRRVSSNRDSYGLQGRIRFGGTAKGFGLNSFALQNKENKRVMLGYALRYGSPLVALAVGFISGPLACCVVPLSLIGLWIAEKKGTELIKSAKRNKLSGIPKHTEHLRHLWEETKKNDILKNGGRPYSDIRKHYNAIVDTVFRNRKGIRRRLYLKPRNRLDRLLEKMFYVQVMYRDHPLGRGIRGMRRLATKPFFRFPLFRYPLVALSWILQLFLTVIASGKAQRFIKKAARR